MPGLPIVILPGNHDPATPDSIWLRGRFDEIGNVAIIGITNQRRVAFPALDLEIWGNAHRDYHDMVPLRDPPPRAARWQIAVGHGHYEPPETWANPLRPSWLISDAMIRETQVRLRRARPLGPRRAGRVRRRAGLLLGRAASRRDRQPGAARSGRRGRRHPRAAAVTSAAEASATGPTAAEQNEREIRPLNLAALSALAFGVGIVTGLGAVVFRELIGLIHNLLFLGDVRGRLRRQSVHAAQPVGAVRHPGAGRRRRRS